jgi:hypothetical protein
MLTLPEYEVMLRVVAYLALSILAVVLLFGVLVAISGG